jgi:hypothetical protein
MEMMGIAFGSTHPTLAERLRSMYVLNYMEKLYSQNCNNKK